MAFIYIYTYKNEDKWLLLDKAMNPMDLWIPRIVSLKI